MKNETLAAQAQLAADILRTGHPWELMLCPSVGWKLAQESNSPIYQIGNGNEIRLALATPGDGRELVNPNNLTAEEVGAGWRLPLKGESLPDGFQYFSCGEWRTATFGRSELCPTESNRLPLSFPWPEAPKVDPKPVMVPLSAEDVPIFSVIRYINQPQDVYAITSIVHGELKSYVNSWPLSALFQRMEINRSMPLTGKWDANVWESCQKPVA